MIHFEVFSEYSVSKSILSIQQLIEHGSKHSVKAMALVDYMKVSGHARFYRQACAQGIKPLLGVEFEFFDAVKQRFFQQPMIAINEQGYHRLLDLLTQAATVFIDQYKKPCLPVSYLDEHPLQDIFVLSGGIFGEVGQAILDDDMSTEAMQDLVGRWQKRAGGHFVMTVHDMDLPRESYHNHHTLELARAMQVPVIFSNKCYFRRQQDHEAHLAKICIDRGLRLDQANLAAEFTEHQCLPSQQQWQKQCAKWSEELAVNARVIAQSCTVVLDMKTVHLPCYDKSMTPAAIDTLLEDTVRQSLAERLDPSNPWAKLYHSNPSVYDSRLDEEIAIIQRMGYCGYFLIVADFVGWSKRHQIAVGPGRGSGAGSLIAFLLDITTIDPIEHGLYFERFLNPERVSMPDFDIDFCMEGRDEVIDYVFKKYGEDHVAQIMTFGTMAAKAVVRDVGRVLGLPYGWVDRIAKLVPNTLGITLKEALKQEPRLKKEYEQHHEIKRLLDLALLLEGRVRSVGRHAGGVVIAPDKITQFTALYTDSVDNHSLTHLDKDDLESIGLVKFDFLGLRTLTIIQHTLQALQAHGVQVDLLNDIEYADADTYAMISTGFTHAVFQLESRGIQEFTKKLAPDNFSELMALVALYRPGPLQSGMVDDFIARKFSNDKIDYLHPRLEETLQSTYGVILYQEQVMQIARELSHYSMGEADLLRRAMGKKKPEEMQRLRQDFISRAVGDDVTEAMATTIFDLIDKFSGYGFNKSHSAAYAVLTYQTAWLKCHYPAYFLASVLSSDPDDTDKVVMLLDEAKRLQLKILPPDINRGHSHFYVNEDQEIEYGLAVIKGVGVSTAQMIASSRHTPYVDLFDFCKRLQSKHLNKRVLEALITSGAMDTIIVNRRSAMLSVPRLLKLVDKIAMDRRSGQLAFMLDDQEHQSAMMSVDEWPLNEKLQYERRALGFFLSSHPVVPYQQELEAIGTLTLEHIEQLNGHGLIAGIVRQWKVLMTKKQKRIGILQLEDAGAVVEVLLFDDKIEQHHQLLADCQDVIIIAVSGQKREDDMRLICQQIYSLDHYRRQYQPSLQLTIDGDRWLSEHTEQLLATLSTAKRGQTEIVIMYQKADKRYKLFADEHFSICLNESVLQSLAAFAAMQVEILYH